MKKKYWRVCAYNGLDLTFEDMIPFDQISETSMELLLKTLAAKIGLSEKEIINSFVKTHSPFLEVKRDKGSDKYKLMCGENPHVIATVIEKDV